MPVMLSVTGVEEVLNALRSLSLTLRITHVTGLRRVANDATQALRTVARQAMQRLARTLPLDQGSLRSGLDVTGHGHSLTVTSHARHRPYVASEVWEDAAEWTRNRFRHARFDTRVTVHFVAFLVIPGLTTLTARSSLPVTLNLNLEPFANVVATYANELELTVRTLPELVFRESVSAFAGRAQ